LFKPPAPKIETAVHALWRVPQWFPKLPPSAIELLKMFHVELLHFNAKVNLIGRGTERESDEAHFADCIYGSQIVLEHSKASDFYDIGSGNGLPGIVLAILQPRAAVWLVEKDLRKCEFLKQMIFRLDLKNVQVVNRRFEELPRGSVDVAVSRGFASISKAILKGNKSFHKDSNYYHFKTGTWGREVAEIPSQVCAVWTPILVGEYALPVNQAQRAILLTKKIA
jgi:16S rRNA (guanine527-N7)-methyltransferase